MKVVDIVPLNLGNQEQRILGISLAMLDLLKADMVERKAFWVCYKVYLKGCNKVWETL